MVATRGWDDKLGGYSWSSTLFVQSRFPVCGAWGVELPLWVLFKEKSERA